MKKALAVFMLFTMLFLVACSNEPETYSDPVTGAQNLNKVQFETIEGLDKSIKGSKLVVASVYDKYIEYHVVNFKNDGTYERFTYQFFYLESDYVEQQNYISSNENYEVIEQDRINRIFIFENSDSSGMKHRIGDYGSIYSGYVNDALNKYIIVE